MLDQREIINGLLYLEIVIYFFIKKSEVVVYESIKLYLVLLLILSIFFVVNSIIFGIKERKVGRLSEKFKEDDNIEFYLYPINIG